MSVIMLEGPEKAGKTSLAFALQKAFNGHLPHVSVRHNVGRALPDDTVYKATLEHETSLAPDEFVCITDRGYPSEYVYGTLLNQKRRLAKSPWLGEWLYGRAIQANGLRVILAGPSAEELSATRTDDDLPVSPQAEKDLYLQYAKDYGWMILEREDLATMVDKVMKAFYKMVNEAQVTGLPPNYCGKPNAETIIVSDGNTTSNMIPGGWLPFSSKIEMNLGMLLANRAFDLGWVYAHYINPVALVKAKTIVACGTKSELWVKNYVMTGGDSSIELITMPHPIHISHTKAEKLQVITKTFNNL